MYKLLPLSASYYHCTTGELYVRKKTRSKVNNKIKRKNPFFSLSSYLPFFCVSLYILPIHQSSISITSSSMTLQLNLIYIKLISNKKNSKKKKSQCYISSCTFEIFIVYQLVFFYMINMRRMYER